MWKKDARMCTRVCHSHKRDSLTHTWHDPFTHTDKSHMTWRTDASKIMHSHTQKWISTWTRKLSFFFNCFSTYTGVEVNVDKSNVNFDVQISVPPTSHNTHLSHPSPCAASATTGGSGGGYFLKILKSLFAKAPYKRDDILQKRPIILATTGGRDGQYFLKILKSQHHSYCL